MVVGARVSKSGSAAPQSGDLEGLSPAVKVGATGIVVVIDRALP
jgi:cytochrome c-type biogenesis protein CcmH